MDEMIEVTLPDGSVVSFPAGTPENEMIAALEQMTATQPSVSASQPIGMGGEAALGATQAAFDAMGAESGRGRNMGDIFNATLRGDQSLSEGVMQTAGQGAGYLGDIIGAGITKLGQGVSYITPDVVEDEVMTQLGIFFDQPLMQMGKEALQAGGEAWNRFSEENPRAARNIAAVTNIAGVGVPTRLAAPSVARTASRVELPSTTRAREAQASMEQGGIEATRDITAPYRLEERPPASWKEGVQDVSAAGTEIPLERRIPSQEGQVLSPERRLVKNPAQQQAIKQGFDEGLVAMIREASPADRRNMLESLSIMERATGNKKFSMLNRTTDVAGKSMLKRYKAIEEANKKAGRSIDRYARNNLKNQYVDFEAPVNNFEANLNDMGITLKDDLTLDFSGSTIEGLAGAERILNQMVKRMRSPRDMTAYEVHTFKKFIDDQVTYGKQVEGLSGQAERAIKQLRRELDEVLDRNFEGYNQANTQYAETIRAMDDFQSVMGRTIDMSSPNAATAIGTKLRGLGSNVQSRGRLLDSLNEMQTLGNKYSGGFDDDVINQAAFTMELDRLFGTKADTSFAGQISEAIGNAPPTTTGQAISAAARAATNKVRGVNQEAQFKAMRELLNSFNGQ